MNTKYALGTLCALTLKFAIPACHAQETPAPNFTLEFDFQNPKIPTELKDSQSQAEQLALAQKWEAARRLLDSMVRQIIRSNDIKIAVDPIRLFPYLYDNAVWTPGEPGQPGHIDFFYGALKDFKTDSGLAFLISHELAHGVLQTIETKRMLTALDQAAPGLPKALKSPYLNRSLEASADRAGLLFAVRAGYSADGWREWISSAKADEHDYRRKNGRRKWRQFKATTVHPLAQERRKRLEELSPIAAGIAARTEAQPVRVLQLLKASLNDKMADEFLPQTPDF